MWTFHKYLHLKMYWQRISPGKRPFTEIAPDVVWASEDPQVPPTHPASTYSPHLFNQILLTMERRTSQSDSFPRWHPWSCWRSAQSRNCCPRRNPYPCKARSRQKPRTGNVKNATWVLRELGAVLGGLGIRMKTMRDRIYTPPTMTDQSWLICRQ